MVCKHVTAAEPRPKRSVSCLEKCSCLAAMVEKRDDGSQLSMPQQEPPTKSHVFNEQYTGRSQCQRLAKLNCT